MGQQHALGLPRAAGGVLDEGRVRCVAVGAGHACARGGELVGRHDVPQRGHRRPQQAHHRPRARDRDQQRDGGVRAGSRTAGSRTPRGGRGAAGDRSGPGSRAAAGCRRRSAGSRARWAASARRCRRVRCRARAGPPRRPRPRRAAGRSEISRSSVALSSPRRKTCTRSGSSSARRHSDSPSVRTPAPMALAAADGLVALGQAQRLAGSGLEDGAGETRRGVDGEAGVVERPRRRPARGGPRARRARGCRGRPRARATRAPRRRARRARRPSRAPAAARRRGRARPRRSAPVSAAPLRLGHERHSMWRAARVRNRAGERRRARDRARALRSSVPKRPAALCYRKASLAALATTNFSRLRAGILIASPVCGLRPMRAL